MHERRSDDWAAMDELRLLHDRIASLNRPDTFSEHGRALMKATESDALSALRWEIEETQVLRKLVFRNDRGETIALKVSSGRVLAMSEPASEKLKSESSGLSSRGLSEHNHEQISALMSILRNFCEETGQVHVQSHLLDTRCDITNVGLPVQKLFEGFQMAATRTEPATSSDRLDHLMEHCVPMAIAILRLDGGQVSHEIGSDDDIRALKDLALQDFSANQDAAGDQGSNSENCMILTGHPENGACILCASNPSSLIFVMFDVAVLDQMYSLWSA